MNKPKASKVLPATSLATTQTTQTSAGSHGFTMTVPIFSLELHSQVAARLLIRHDFQRAADAALTLLDSCLRRFSQFTEEPRFKEKVSFPAFVHLATTLLGDARDYADASLRAYILLDVCARHLSWNEQSYLFWNTEENGKRLKHILQLSVQFPADVTIPYAKAIKAITGQRRLERAEPDYRAYLKSFAGKLKSAFGANAKEDVSSEIKRQKAEGMKGHEITQHRIQFLDRIERPGALPGRRATKKTLDRGVGKVAMTDKEKFANLSRKGVTVKSHSRRKRE